MKANITVTVSTLLGCLYFIYFYLLDEPLTSGSLGTLGDFIGGNINPILTFITTVLLIETLALQRKATAVAVKQADDAKESFEDQRLVAKIQIFESSFFNLINLCLDTCKSAEITHSSKNITGLKAFEFIEEKFTRIREQGEPPSDVFKELDDEHGDICFNAIKSFGNLFAFIDESAPASEKNKYISIATRMLPTCIIYLICIAKLHTKWEIVKPFDKCGFFEKKGITDLLEGFS
ncbi:hypothetical protein GV819_30720 [Pseudomonas sp. Fl5BN2]|uniref:hypothetical protein n=1 Tax=Pseudomonas sp. Fl5BN2 TaxID=2697652 RepID=UPI001377FC4D|nr:hypothetical protein [Pseudomonas sp. Fl5BN2]NBF06647.1 hypothetical protein [Pseudomonas sp. Fl5BN2]